MKKEYIGYGMCTVLTIKAVILPDWPTTIAILFAVLLCGFWMALDSYEKKQDASKEIRKLSDEVVKVSERLSNLSLKIGIKK